MGEMLRDLSLYLEVSLEELAKKQGDKKEKRMIRKWMVVLLSGVICLLGIIPAFAQEKSMSELMAEAQKTKVYQFKEYEELTGKKLVFNEAPELRVKVAAGELPPIEERLPEEPLVVEGVEGLDGVGQSLYGGALQVVHWGASWELFELKKMYLYEFPAIYTADMTRVIPNVLLDFKASDDAKRFTLYLRKGMRWSDGAPFTADDFLFYFQDFASNEELNPSGVSRFMVGGELGIAEKIDDYTLEVSFSNPYGVFIENLSRWRDPPFMPKHYMKQFHPKYTAMGEIEKVMKEEGFDTWIELFGAKNLFAENSEIPTISPWLVQNSATAPVQILTRNPYYWKVDTEGNQLPYIDRIERTLVSNVEASTLKILAGEVDVENHWFLGGIRDYPILKQGEEKGNYQVVPCWGWIDVMGTIVFNFSHKDPILKKLFNDKRFRIALSVALNRDEVNDFILEGLGDLSNPTTVPGPPFYGERLFKNYLQYDPELSNQLLDELGLAKRDAQGYRLRPDGERLRIVNTGGAGVEMADIQELYKGYWEAVGIEVVNKILDGAIIETKYASADYDLVTTRGTLAGRPGIPLTRSQYGPPVAGTYHLAPQWALWFSSGGEKGEEPPEEMKQIMALTDEALSDPSEQNRIDLTLEIFGILEEGFWVFAAFTPPTLDYYNVVSNRLGNVPGMMFDNEFKYENMENWFIRK